ncbi:hypothetical protein V8E51_017729 [Hyaloscypha variabilis]
MRISLVQALSLATVALAQTPGFDPFFTPADQSKLNINNLLPVAWNATVTGGTITPTLIGGSSSKDLAPVTVIAASISNAPGAPTTYPWPIPPNIGTFASYGVNLTSDGSSDFQYSAQFYISGGTGVSSPTTTGSDTTVTQTTQTTSTVTLGNSTSTSGEGITTSGGLTPTKGSTTTGTSMSSTRTATGTGSGEAAPSPTKNAGSEVGFGSLGLLGIGGAVMAFLL